ncbi:MAG: hypothetical protein JNM52_02775 [Betaproteobacteria bacterium]|nr:hypothetical protein [Betaproteobacteria bacterium]
MKTFFKTEIVSSARYQPLPAAMQGVTLIEMLVSMTLFFMVAGILTSAITQAMRLAQASREEVTGSRDALMRLGWFRDTISLAVIDAGADKPFKGSERSVAGFTHQSLNRDNAGPGAFEWRLAFNNGRAETELLYVADNQAAQVVYAWPGSSGKFRYLDATGQWHQQWPPFTSTGAGSNDAIPAAVELSYGNDAGVLLAAIQSRAQPLPALKDL